MTDDVETARAVLFSGDLVTGKTSMDVFTEDDDHKATWSDGRPMDPYHRAALLRDSCEGDFPDRVWAIHVNDPARVLMGEERMRAMGIPAEEVSRCARCGLPDGPDYGDPHECPPGFQTAAGVRD